MRTIAHISDLHFGRLDCAVLPALAKSIAAAAPDVVVVSGDLTQRARRREFAEARRFLDTLPTPRIVVPGNHDVPLYDLLSRWRAPLAKYRQYITDDLEPFYADDEIAVLGINTARSLAFKGGRINTKQVASICARLEACAGDVTRVVVAHHPFDVPETARSDSVVGRAGMAMEAFARCSIDMILTGHLHVSRAASSAVRYRIAGYSALMVQAGTATSSRRRGELNSWNLIRIARPQVSIECLSWADDRAAFAVSRSDRFQLAQDDWCRLPAEFHAGEKMNVARAPRRGAVVYASVCLLLFVLLAMAVSLGAARPFDDFVRSGIHSWASAPLTALAQDFSLLGSVAILAVLFVVAQAGFWWAGLRPPAIALALAMAGAVVLDNLLKYAFHRVRPEPFFGISPETYSFPSGHVLFSACFYGMLGLVFAADVRSVLSRAAIWAAAALLVSAIGLSRIYLGVHYPTDVIAGLLVGLFWLGAMRSWVVTN